MGIGFAMFVKSYTKSKGNRDLVRALVLFVIFAISRQVHYSLGGEDSYNYEMSFLSSKQELPDMELLFAYFTRAIRNITSSPIIYRFFCYLLIGSGYFYFIKTFCPRKSSAIPYIALIIPFILSFNTMRSSMAAAIILLGMVFLQEKRYFWATVFCLAAVFFHRMAALFVPFLLFYLIFKNGWLFKSRIRFLVIVFSIIFVSVFCVSLVKDYIILLGALDSTDSYYLTRNSDASILSASSYLLPLVLIGGFIFISRFKELYEEHPLLMLMVVYDIVIFPASFMLGMWRVNEFFYVARLTMWAILIYQFRFRFTPSSRQLVTFMFLGGFILWTVNRINAVWKDASLMPYLLNWF